MSVTVSEQTERITQRLEPYRERATITDSPARADVELHGSCRLRVSRLKRCACHARIPPPLPSPPPYRASSDLGVRCYYYYFKKFLFIHFFFQRLSLTRLAHILADGIC